MGFSIVGAGTVLFIGLLVSSTMIANAYFAAERDVREATRDERARDAFVRATDLRLDSSDYQGSRLHLYYTNTGSTVLHLDNTHLIIDGDWSNDLIDERDVDGDSAASIWPPGTQLHLRVDIQPRPDRAWFVVESGRAVLALT